MRGHDVTHAVGHGSVAFGAGLIFAVGLALSGMTVPANVIAFLDVFGSWDPTLAFVMGGAIAVHAPIYWLFVRGRETPTFARTFGLPTRRDIDVPLLAGAVLFGAGWGLAGFCPGPAVTSLASGASTVWWFVVAMLVGMAAFSFVGFMRGRKH